MRHDLCLDGEAFRLRPVGDDDAAFIVWLRRNPALSRYLHATDAGLDRQLQWLAAYYDRPGDYYFVVETCRGAEREGLVAIYDQSADGTRAEWGRWILREGSLAAPESAALVYRCAFDRLGLSEVYCRTVRDNAAVVSFHDSCGIRRRLVLPGHFELDGTRHDAVEHLVDRADWARFGPSLQRLAGLVARRMDRG